MSQLQALVLLLLLANAPQMFRAEAHVVRVPVWTVKASAGWSGDPRAFSVTDNGVLQRVATVDDLRAPIDVTVVFESRGLDRTLQIEGIAGRSGRAEASLSEDIAAALSDLRRVLGKDDSITMLDASGSIGPWDGSAAHSHESAVLDAIALALTATSKSHRNQVIVAISNGVDTLSVTTRELRLVTVARSTAPVFAVLIRRGQAAAAASRQWADGRVAAVTPIGEVPSEVPELARASGGWALEVSSSTPIAEAVRGALDAYRSGYMLSYVPTGVSRGGWHSIVVTHQSGAGIRHRAGYWDDVTLR